MHYSNDELISGILKSDEKILKEIYRKFYPAVKRFIYKNSGVDNDARDVFNDGLIILFNKLQSGTIDLHCSPGTYLISVCSLIWRKKLTRQKKALMVMETFLSDSDVNMKDAHELFVDSEKQKLFTDHLIRLEQPCRQILSLFFDRVPMKEIAVLVGLPDEKSAKRKKFSCKENLLISIRNDPRYIELMEESLTGK
ncbi:MAG: sigma-70 family RNA polymerase sigma factor [Bacteroidota bacterium]